MRKKNKNLTFLSLVLLSCVFIFSACDKNTEEPNPTPESKSINYAICALAGSYPNYTSYIQGLKSLEGEVKLDKAKEISRPALLWGKGGQVFVSLFGKPLTLSKYTFQDNGLPIEGKQFVEPAAVTVPTICYVDKHEAYAGLSGAGGLHHVIRFDPMTMEKTGEISLESIKKEGIKTVLQMQMVHRGDKLFMGLVYGGYGGGEVIDDAFVVVIDRKNLKVEKLISDSRTSRIYTGGQTMSSITVMPNGNIYVMAEGSENKPSGILRILNGQTDFDKDYFINLDKLMGSNCHGLEFIGDMKAVTLKSIDPENAGELKGPNHKYCVVDLKNKISLGEIKGLPLVYGVPVCAFCKLIDGEYLLNAAEKDLSTVYKLDPNTLKVTPKMTIRGKLTGLVPVK